MSKRNMDMWAHCNEKSHVIVNEQNGHVEVQDACFLWDNFRGDTDQFGNAKKLTHVLIPMDKVQQLIDLGYTIKSYPVDKDKDGNVAVDDNGNPILMYFIKVNINMKSAVPPVVKLMTKFKGDISTRVLDDNSIGDLHGLDVALACISWNRYVRNQGKTTVVSAYMDKISVVAEEDAEFGGIIDDYLESYNADDVVEGE